jgi:hypothetical protein
MPDAKVDVVRQGEETDQQISRIVQVRTYSGIVLLAASLVRVAPALGINCLGFETHSSVTDQTIGM